MTRIALWAGFALAAFAPAPALAQIIVRQDGGGDALTIAAGIALAADGEEVRVTDGLTYNESIFLPYRILTSVPAGATITSGGGSATVQMTGADAPEIHGFNVIHTSGAPAIEVSKFDPTTTTIQDCALESASGTAVLFNVFGASGGVVLFDNVDIADSSNGIHVTGTANDINVTADDLTMTNIGGIGVRVSIDADLSIDNSSISDCNQVGILLEAEPASLSMTNTSVTDCALGGINISTDNVSMDLHGCTLDGNQYGILRAGNDLNTPCVITIDSNSVISDSTDTNLRIFDPTDLTISDSTISGATGTSGLNLGHGVHLLNGGEQDFTATNVTFENNAGAGLFVEVGNSPDPTGALQTIARCLFDDNTDGAIQVSSAQNSGVELDVSRTTFRLDTASPTFGIELDQADAAFTNCLFDHGGTVQLYCSLAGGETVNVRHCVFVDTAGFTQAIAAQNGGTVVVRNSIIEASGGQAYFADSGAAIDDNYNNVRGPMFGAALGANTGTGNPLFTTASAGPGTGDFHLQAGSPGNGTGDPGLGVTVDFSGNARPNPALSDPDKGIYETAAVPVELSAFEID